MDEFSSLLLVGSIIPALAFIIKKIIIKMTNGSFGNEILIKSENGKKLKFIGKPDISESEIKFILDSELNFETMVKKQINHFITSHEKFDLKLSDGNTVDFVVSHGDKVIGVEAKSNADLFKAKWIHEYFKGNDGIEELIMIIDSEIPREIIKEVELMRPLNRVRLISSPNGKDLPKLIKDFLTTELGLEKQP